MENKKTFNELWDEYKNLCNKYDRHDIYIERIYKAIDFARKYISKGIETGAIDTLRKWEKCKKVIKKLEDGCDYCYNVRSECAKKRLEILEEM